MAEVVEMIVESFQLRQDRPQIAGAFRNLTLAGCFDCLAKRKRMGNAVHPGNAFREQYAKVRRQPFEAFFHPAMFEEEPRMTMENRFADVVEDDLRRFEHVSADRAEWQDLNIAPFHWRKIPRFSRIWNHFVFRIARIERRNRRMSAFMQHQRARLRMALKGDPAEILHLSLVPTEERNSRRKRLQLAVPCRQTAAQQWRKAHEGP